MKYIRIKNNGLIEPQALHLVGASTKRTDATKIGQFGSGNKYALAYFLRNGMDVAIFAGLNQITIETKPETFRECEFNVIYINGEKTSITTEMGKDWEFWQAIREVYCNAIDEGGVTLDFVTDLNPQAGETHFYIKNNSAATTFMVNFDNYFATNKKVLFECEYGRILEKSGGYANIYRKGILCHVTTKKSLYDYDFNDVSIDENRLMRYTWQLDAMIWKLIFQCTDKAIIERVLHNGFDSQLIEANISDWNTIDYSTRSEEFLEVITNNKIAPIGMSGLLKPDEQGQYMIIPTQVFKAIRGDLHNENLGDNFKTTKTGGMFREIQPDKLQAVIISKAEEFLKEVGFENSFEIKLAIFDNKETLGYANEFIYLSDLCVSKGVNEVVNVIIEEFIHLKYGCKDETRHFQTSIITEFIEYMKKTNSFAI